MVASAGVRAAMYGAAVAAISDTTLRLFHMRVAQRRMPFCAPGFLLPRKRSTFRWGALGRVRVVTVSLIAPWDFLAGVVAAGVADAAALFGRLASGPRRGGPLHAASVALRRCGVTLVGDWLVRAGRAAAGRVDCEAMRFSGAPVPAVRSQSLQVCRRVRVGALRPKPRRTRQASVVHSGARLPRPAEVEAAICSTR